jgi:hypothetical protein
MRAEEGEEGGGACFWVVEHNDQLESCIKSIFRNAIKSPGNVMQIMLLLVNA